MRSSWKLSALLLALALLLLPLAGCATSTPGGASVTASTQAEASDQQTAEASAPVEEEKEPVTIVVGGWPAEESQDYPTFQKYLEKMKELYPYITIEPNEYAYNVNTFLPLAASGQLPTIYGTYFTEPEKIISAGYCADITDVLTSYGYDAAINPDLLELVTRDDRIYGIPYSAYSMGVWYNLTVLEKAGLLEGVKPVFPKTYEELAQTASTIKKKTGIPGFYMLTNFNQGGWTFMNIAWSYGATFEEQINGKWTATFNSPEAVAALQFVKDLRWKYDCLQDNLLVTADDMMTAFGTNQVGMAFGTLDWTNSVVQNTGISKDAMAMSQVPGGPAGQVAQMGGSIYMFAPESTPEQLDACIKWLQLRGFKPEMDDAAQAALRQDLTDNNAKGYAVGPLGISVWVDPTYNEVRNGIYSEMANVNMDLWNDFCQNASKNIRPEEPINCQELYATLDAVIQSVLTDKNADPQKLLDEAVATFQREYLDNVK